jgi:hypothetical protein
MGPLENSELKHLEVDMTHLCGYNDIKWIAAAARTGLSIKGIGNRDARFFGMAKEDLDGSEA